MELGMVGLGRMGANMAQRLARGGHAVSGFDPSAQARQRTAHRGRAQSQPPRGTRDAALREQHVERHQQIEVGAGHPGTIART